MFELRAELAVSIRYIYIAFAGADEIRQEGGARQELASQVGQGASGVDTPQHTVWSELLHEFKKCSRNSRAAFLA